MAYTNVKIGFVGKIQEFTDKAVTSKKALAKFARKKGPPKGKPTKGRKAS
jgi:hypothetical protein